MQKELILHLIKEPALSYDDVLLRPQTGFLSSRSDADISTRLLGDIKLDIPIISAPMDSVTGPRLAANMRTLGGFGILHRFHDTIDDQVDDYTRASLLGSFRRPCLGCAIGINENLERYIKLYDAGCRVFCIDVAHGDSEHVFRLIKMLPFRDDVGLIVGSVATRLGAISLFNLGVDAIRVGVGPGAACTTRTVTGFGVPQLSAIMEVADAITYMRRSQRENEGYCPTIIADGGIKNSGDIVKALAAGADTVMLGSLLAGTDESPQPGKYWGAASKKMNGHNAPEGVEGFVPKTGSLGNTLKELVWGIKSGVSYGGASNLAELREMAEFQVVSPMSVHETNTRILEA